MKMWFKGSCFFRNFPHWGSLLSRARSMPGLPSPVGSFAGQCHAAAVALWGRSKATSLTGDKTACTSPLVGTGTLAIHRMFPCCFLVLACQEWGKM